MPKKTIELKEKMLGVANKSLLVRVIAVLAVAILIATAYAWWHYIQSSPERVFVGAVNNSLRTNSFSRQTVQEMQGQKFEENVAIATYPKQVANGYNKISMTGEGGYDVVTEAYGTPTTDYIRYKSIKVDQKTSAGKVADFTSIIGIWGKTTSDKTTNGQLYNQSVMGAMPIGNLSLANRKIMMNIIKDKKVYTVDYKKIERSKKGRRPIYVYSVKVNTEGYVHLLQQYAKLVGLNQLDGVNPSDYKDQPPLEFKFTVDVLSRRVISVEDLSSKRIETFNGFGSRITGLDVPPKNIPMEELQQKIQDVSNQ